MPQIASKYLVNQNKKTNHFNCGSKYFDMTMMMNVSGVSKLMATEDFEEQDDKMNGSRQNALNVSGLDKSDTLNGRRQKKKDTLNGSSHKSLRGDKRKKERTPSMSLVMDFSLEDCSADDCSEYFEEMEKVKTKTREAFGDSQKDSDGFQRRKINRRRITKNTKSPRTPRSTRGRSKRMLYAASESESEGDMPSKPSMRNRSTECPDSPEARLFRALLVEGTLESYLDSKTWEHLFRGVTNERVSTYSTSAAKAVKKGDFSRLVQLYEDNPTIIDGCNEQGESLLHLACRSGNLQIVQFLLDKAPTSAVRVQDKVGRTVLHEAVWTSKPNYDLILALLTKAPELLVVVDDRGFTALNYIPKTCWDDWNEFLEEQYKMLQPRMNIKRCDEEEPQDPPVKTEQRELDKGLAKPNEVQSNTVQEGIKDLVFLKPSAATEDLTKKLDAAQERMQHLMARVNAAALILASED